MKNNTYRHSNGFRSSRPGIFRGKMRRYSREPKSLNPLCYVKKAVIQEQEQYVSANTFDDFAFSPGLKQNISARGYTDPTPIQDKAIPLILKGKDVIGIANTGTGKTVAFLLPLIEKIVNDKSQGAVIIAPTRELAVQIYDELQTFTKSLNIASTICVGGTSLRGQINDLSRRPHFVIATPGRIKDLSERRAINFQDYTSIVLDEVDRMLDMGFINDIKFIISKLPENRHSLFFSATLPENIKKLAYGFLKNPEIITVAKTQSPTNIDQDIIRINGRKKEDVLHNLLIQEEFSKVLVFGRTKWGVERLARTLTTKGLIVSTIHGNKNQNQRLKALESFKKNNVRILLATDVASRGLDIDGVTHVINFDEPESYEDYIHRIGRTGRANKRGFALTFVQ